MVNEKIISPLSPAPLPFSLLFPSFLPNCSNPRPQIQLYLLHRLSLSHLYQTRIRHIFSHPTQPIASKLSAYILLPSSPLLLARFSILWETTCFWKIIRHLSKIFLVIIRCLSPIFHLDSSGKGTGKAVL